MKLCEFKWTITTIAYDADLNLKENGVRGFFERKVSDKLCYILSLQKGKPK